MTFARKNNPGHGRGVQEARREAPPADEAALMDAIRLALGQREDIVLWRNNVGLTEYWDGKSVSVVKYGLANGSADFVGVLLPGGRFVAFEVKTRTGRATPEQLQWLALVRRFGGFACIVRSVDEAIAAVARAKGGASE